MNNSKKPCFFFQKGQCRYGDKCNNLHVMSNSNQNTDEYDNISGKQHNGGNMNQKSTSYDMSSNTINTNNPNTENKNSKICGYFLKGSCTKESCKFFHGYSEILQNVMIEKIHEKAIVALSGINEKKFISADESTVQIWQVTEDGHNSIGTQTFTGEKITKAIYSNEKVIAATMIDQMLSTKAKLYVICDMGMFSQDSNLKKINDIIEVDSYVFAVGEGGAIDIFLIDMVNGTLNRLNPVMNENDLSEMMCITFSPLRTLFMVGHQSGVISAFMPDTTSILKLAGFTKIHDGAINRIFLKDTMVGTIMQQFVMTCSSDGYLKVFKSDESFENIASKNFDSGVYDIFQTCDYEKTETFILSLLNGELLAVNLNLETLFKIPSHFNSKKRFAINIQNPYKGDIEGNFLILSDGGNIDVNMWIKAGAFDTIVETLKGQSQGGHQSGQSGQRGQDGHRGGYRGYKGGYRGGNRGGYQGGQGHQSGGSQGGHQGGHQGGYQGGYRK